MELILSLDPPGETQDIALIHVFNGRPEWYPHSYLEDVLLRQKIADILRAAAMIDEGIGYVPKKEKYDYI